MVMLFTRSSSLRRSSALFVLSCAVFACSVTTAFRASVVPTAVSRRLALTGERTVTMTLTSAVEAPTREKTDRKTGGKSNNNKYNSRENDSSNKMGDDYDEDDYDDIEYLMDPNEQRGMEDPFHILLLGSTFEKPKVTVSYVSTTLEYVISIPRSEAVEQAKFAKDQGMSCLGTWPREECLSLGRQLQVRDVVIRVVPYCEGGQRGWQAKDVSSSSSSSTGNSKSGAAQ